MAIDEYYDLNWEDKPLEDSRISRRNVKFFTVMGQSSYRRYNIHFLEDDTIIYIVGNKY